MVVTKQIRVVLSALDGFVETLIKKLVLDIVANFQAAPSEGGTPVDTGWARANWIPTIGDAPSTAAAPKPEGDNISVSVASLGQQQAVGVATVAATYKLSRGAVHISNNVPYIVRLDGGSSQQAPRGFVLQGIIKALRGL